MTESTGSGSFGGIPPQDGQGFPGQNPGVPSNMPPTNMPPMGTPPTGMPPTGMPPTGPPGGPIYQGAPEPKKKRWPWIVGGLFLLCALPLGGCVAFLATGLSAIGEIQDEIETVADDMFIEASSGNIPGAAAIADGAGNCATAEQLEAVLTQFTPLSNWEFEGVNFVQRTDNTTIGNVGDSDSFTIDGRTDESAALIQGTIDTGAGTKNLRLDLTKPTGDWRVCGITID